MTDTDKAPARVQLAPPPDDPAETATPAWWRTWLGPGVWVVAFLVQTAWYGLPAGRDVITVWVVLGLVAFAVGSGWRMLLRLVRDWAPALAFLYVYDLLRGFSSSEDAHVLPQIRADEWMTGGTVPTVWLQEHLWDPSRIAWYDWVVTVVYMSHFVVTLFVGVVLWGRFYRLFPRYMTELFSLIALSLLTYWLFPAAPPWLASQDGVIGPVQRVVYAALQQLPMGDWGQLFTERGPEYANDVAAIPSMHAALPMLLAVFFWPHVRTRWGRALLAAYPLLMCFTLVYGGEHYIVDVLIGWAYAIAVHRLVGRWFARRSALVGPPDADRVGQGQQRQHEQADHRGLHRPPIGDR